MRWDGLAHAETVKDRIYTLLHDCDIEKASIMNNNDYADYLKKSYRHSSFNEPDKPNICGTANGLEITFKKILLNNAGEKTIALSWSMAARHIRAWELEKTIEAAEAAKCEISKPTIKDIWDSTHLCGDVHGEHCEFLLPTAKGTTHNGKTLDDYSVYCIRNDKCRKIGHQATWTGLTPTYCRKRLELSHSLLHKQQQNEPEQTKENMVKEINMRVAQDIKIEQIPINMLIPYRNHMFTLYSGERLDDMVQSIKTNGIMMPIIVRALNNNQYEILAGHNRCNAAKLAGLAEVPSIVKKDLSDEEAEMYVIETNLMQRGLGKGT